MLIKCLFVQVDDMSNSLPILGVCWWFGSPKRI